MDNYQKQLASVEEQLNHCFDPVKRMELTKTADALRKQMFTLKSQLSQRPPTQTNAKPKQTQSDKGLSPQLGSWPCTYNDPACPVEMHRLQKQVEIEQKKAEVSREKELKSKVIRLQAEVARLRGESMRLVARPAKPPMEKLGPFATRRNVRIGINAVESVIEGGPGWDGTMYEITKPKKLLQLCSSINLPTIGSISPVSKITLPKENWIHANIPENADTFAFAYPPAGFSQLTSDQKKHLNFETPSYAFMAFGGYVYFNKKGEALQLNAIDVGPGLNFDGPFKLSKLALASLRKQGRMQPITVQQLLDTGAKYFCWLRPSEVLPDLVTQVEDGGFAYDYGGDGSKNRYFRIVSEPVQDTNANNTSWHDNSDAEQEGTQGLCIKCRLNSANCVLLPCKHMATCTSCADQVVECPMCDKTIRMKIEVNLPE
eukprot:m.64901 g.64901  ORF g.64901 m.64901 type:complete len:430 (+) comp23495_c0_seq1:239-1528(+)